MRRFGNLFRSSIKGNQAAENIMFANLRRKVQTYLDQVSIGITGAHLREWFRQNPNASRKQQIDAVARIIAKYSPLPPDLVGCKAMEVVTEYRIKHGQPISASDDKSDVEIGEDAWLREQTCR